MSQTNSNRNKVQHKPKLSYSEATIRLVREKDNKQQRRKARYDWN